MFVIISLFTTIVYYVLRPGSRILHSRVDCCKHAYMISYFPSEVRLLFFFILRLQSSTKHARTSVIDCWLVLSASSSPAYHRSYREPHAQSGRIGSDLRCGKIRETPFSKWSRKIRTDGDSNLRSDAVFDSEGKRLTNWAKRRSIL